MNSFHANNHTDYLPLRGLSMPVLAQRFDSANWLTILYREVIIMSENTETLVNETDSQQQEPAVAETTSTDQPEVQPATEQTTETNQVEGGEVQTGTETVGEPSSEGVADATAPTESADSATAEGLTQTEE